jgi:hypothetical protein
MQSWQFVLPGGWPTFLCGVCLVSTGDGPLPEWYHSGRLLRSSVLVLSGAPSFAGVYEGWEAVDLLSTSEVYILPIPAHLRLAVENLSQLVTNGDELHQSSDEALAAAE